MSCNIVELLADDDEHEDAPCAHGHIIVGHACYCHHPDGPRKCPQWAWGRPWEDCPLSEARTPAPPDDATPTP